MNIIFSIVCDFLWYFNFKSSKGRIRFMVVVIITAITGFFIFPQEDTESNPAANVSPVVTLRSVTSFGAESALELLGTVSAINEAEITNETGGRVVSVPVEIGSVVNVGSVIARLESSAQYAALLQAEGGYEAALAAAEISNVSVAEALRGQQTAITNAKNTLLATENSLTTIFYSQLDDIYNDPDNVYRTPGFMSADAAPLIRQLRSDFQYFDTSLKRWENKIATADTAEKYLLLLEEMRTEVNRMSSYATTFRTLITADNSSSDSFGTTGTAYLTTLGQIDSELSSMITSIINTKNAIEQAADTLRRAQLGGTTENTSAASAQVKQALGNLRAAQAAYNKTIITAPIAGSIAALPIKVGEYVTAFSVVAKITNDTAYEITTFLTEQSLSDVAVGDAVILNGKSEGVVSSIANTISPGTARREIKIQSTDDRLVSGETVRIRFDMTTTATANDTNDVAIPLTAVKFQGTNGFVFTVSDQQTLVAHQVQLGRTQGANIVITDGIDAAMEIVIDARGLSDGQTVTVK